MVKYTKQFLNCLGDKIMVRVLIKRIPKKNSREIQQQTNLHWVSIVTETFVPPLIFLDFDTVKRNKIPATKN